MFFIASLCIVSPTWAEGIIRFDHLTSAQGLTHNAVTTQFLDSRGFMWIGTAYGLNRYDGYEFKTFRPTSNDSLSLPHHWVRAIAEDAQGRLFIGTAKGLVRYDRQTEAFHRIVIKSELLPHIVQLKSDTTGQILINTSNNIFKMRLDNRNKVVQMHPILHNTNTQILSFLEDHNGSMWVGTQKGLAYWHAQADSLIWYRSPTKQNDLFSIHTLYRSPHNHVWAGTELGLYQIDKPTHTLTTPIPSLTEHAVTALFENRHGQLWAGTRNHGLFLAHTQTENTTPLTHNPNDPSSLGAGSVVSIIKDRANMMWIATYGGGISLYTSGKRKMKAFTHIPDVSTSLNNSTIFSVLKDKKGIVWVGTSNGINRLTPNGRVSQVYKHIPHSPSGISHNVVRALLEDKKSRFWVGTDAGLNLLDRNSKTITAFQHNAQNPNSLSDNTIRRIHEGKDGILWIGTNNGGLNRFDPATRQITRITEMLPNLELGGKCIRAIYEDTTGTLWLGTTRGLARYHPTLGKSKVFLHNAKDPTTLSTNSIYAIAPAIDGGLWIGTSKGLNHLNTTTEQFTHYTLYDGLSSNIIYNIFSDTKGDLWTNSDRGISHIQISLAVDNKHLTVRNFNQTDGVVSTEFNTGASFQAPDGTLFMGGMSGLNVFHPDSLYQANAHSPPIVFTACEVYTGRDMTGSPSQSVSGISERKTIHLPHTTTHIHLSFSALDFVAPNKNEYAYWLEGLEPDWIHLKYQRHLSLSLSPGTYQLHVQGSNNDGLWNKNGRTLGIVVATPYWMTHWFRGGAVILIITLISIGHRLRLQRIKIQNAKLDKLVQELETKNTELERFTYTVSHDLKSPLVTIEGFLGMIEKDVTQGQLDRVTNDAKFIRNAVANMHDLLDDLLDLSRVGRMMNDPEPVPLGDLIQEAANLVQGRFQAANITLSIEGHFPTVMGDRRRLLEVFQNLLDNAAKFSAGCPNPHVEVGHRQDNSETILFVKDNGVGIDSRYHTKIFGLFERLDTSTEGTGIGLALVKRIVEFHNGRIWVESDGEGKGSTQCFTLPGIHLSDNAS